MCSSGVFSRTSAPASVRRRRPRCCRRMAHCKSRCWGRRPREADAHRARSSSTLSSPVCQDSSLATTCAQYPPSLRQSSTACSSVAHHPMVLVQRSSWQCQLVPSERCWVAYSVVLWQTSWLPYGRSRQKGVLTCAAMSAASWSTCHALFHRPLLGWCVSGGTGAIANTYIAEILRRRCEAR